LRGQGGNLFLRQQDGYRVVGMRASVAGMRGTVETGIRADEWK
jgi:hypothetical protein